MTPQNLHKNAVLQACFRLQAEIEMLLVAHPKAGARYGKSANVDLNLLGWFNPKAGAEIVTLEREYRDLPQSTCFPGRSPRQVLVSLRIEDIFEKALAEARIKLQYVLDSVITPVEFANPGCLHRQHATETM